MSGSSAHLYGARAILSYSHTLPDGPRGAHGQVRDVGVRGNHRNQLRVALVAGRAGPALRLAGGADGGSTPRRGVPDPAGHQWGRVNPV